MSGCIFLKYEQTYKIRNSLVYNYPIIFYPKRRLKITSPNVDLNEKSNSRNNRFQEQSQPSVLFRIIRFTNGP